MKKAVASTVMLGAAAATLWLQPAKKKPRPELTPASAERDSFPVIVSRDTLGRRAGTFEPGDGTIVCGLGRNRYTGEVRIFIPADAPLDVDAYLATVCERARVSYAAERSG